ncbi:MAG: cupin domain-containing protein [Bryobacteraceae bacterium]|nr:cupin domain-containing protein [Bryobacteraceae bacterium]
MKKSRRDYAMLLPMMAPFAARAQDARLPSRTFRFEDLPVRKNGENRSRAVLEGRTHGGFPIEMHQTELAPGLPPHPPHHHEHEEVLLIREGTLEVTIADKVSRLGPGSVAFIASNEEHGWRNVGDTRAHYFIVTLGRPPR